MPAKPVLESLAFAPLSRAFLGNLLRLQLITPRLAEEFVRVHVERLSKQDSAEACGQALIEAGLLTPYQLEQILAGSTHGLVLGNYRVLGRLGAGGMGVVLLGEHTLMQRKVAIKVLPVDEDCPGRLLDRFYTEMRVLAQLHHPNIVLAYDSGFVSAPPGLPHLLYLVMELIDGCDLERWVETNGPAPIGKACDWARQAACGLQEAHNHDLVHRDVKPSNLLLNQDGQIKLVDFGLVRNFAVRLTDPKAMLGTLDFMAPEQSTDPAGVGTHADIYALGATLFWLLTGESPYPVALTLADSLRQLQHTPARRLRTLRPDAPSELEAVLTRMLERDPLRRPPMALAVMKALQPFLEC
jgi:serine/threonine protein kinase